MNHKANIELVVFDMDGVLAHLDYSKRLATLAQLTGRSADFIHAAVYASGFERDAEAGAYASGTEYLSEYNRRIGFALTREQWVVARRDAMEPIPETFAVARRLKIKTRLATLTNNGSLLKEAIADILPPAAELFGASFHASYEFGARKPEPRVFERLAARYGIAPGRVLFIDDMPEYLDGARSAGLNVIRFTTANSLSDELYGLGLL